MSVSQRGYVALSQGAVGRSVAWPAGTVAGDLAVLVLMDSDGRSPAGPSGWTYGGRHMWWRLLTAADVAAALSAPAVVVGVVVWAGAGVPSSSTRQSSVSVPAGGAAFFVGRSWWGGAPGGATGRLGGTLTLSGMDVTVGMWGFTSAAAGVVSVGGASGDASWTGLVVPSLPGPAVPTLLSPTSGQQVAAGSAIPLSWVHHSTVGGVQTAYRVQVRAVGAGSWSYVAADGTLNAAVQTVTSAAGSASINAGLLTAGTSHEWSVSTQEAGVWSATAPVATFVPVASPSVSSVSVSSPLGTLAPAVSWSAAAGVGALTAFQVAVTVSTDATPDAPLYDSGVQVGAGSAWTVPARSDWTNGGSYKAWVRVAQAGGLWSPWVSGSFTVSWTAPAAPAAVTVAQGSPPVVTIGSVPSGHGVGVQWSSDAGATWTTLATLAAGAAGSRTLAVPLTPFGVAVLFRARSVLASGGVELVSAWTMSDPFTSADEAAYLVSASDPAEYVRVSIRSDGGRSVIQSVAVWSPLGGSRVRVDRGVAQGDSGTTTLQTETDADTQTLLSWLTGDAFWLRWNPETQAGVKLGMAPTLMAVADAPSRERIAQIPIGWRRITFPWVQQ